MNAQVHNILPQFSNSILQRIREQTASDPELNALKEMIHFGWPSTILQVPVPKKPYCSFRDELSVEDGIAMKSHRIVIPTVLQKEILTKLYAAHQGTEKTNLRARTSVYWRGLNKDIDEITTPMPGDTPEPAKRAPDPHRGATKGTVHYWNRPLYFRGFRVPSSR